MNITVLDTETTGLNHNTHEIIQLGLLRLATNEEGLFETQWEKEYNLTPLHIETASPEALKINGYTPDKWVNSVPFRSIVDTLDSVWRESDFLLGQNLIFDLRFISKSYRELGLNIPEYPDYIDTKFMGESLVKEGLIKSSSIDKMCVAFGIKFKGVAHTALTDCQRTATLWETLLKYTNQKVFSFKEPYDPHANTNSITRKVI